MQEIPLRLERTGQILATAELADRSADRRRGLLGRDGLPPGRGLLLRPCSSVHTFFMRFAIDVVFLDREGRITRMAERVAPRRLAWGGWRAWQTLELRAGAVREAGAIVGDRLVDGRSAR